MEVMHGTFAVFDYFCDLCVVAGRSKESDRTAESRTVTHVGSLFLTDKLHIHTVGIL